jgi:hypothetical protein
MLYKAGQGVEQDNAEAYFWQRLAVSEWTSTHVPVGESYAAAMEETGSRLTDVEQFAVRRRVDVWIADHSAEVV